MSTNQQSNESPESVQAETGIGGGDPFHRMETDLMRLEARMRQLATQHPECADRGSFGPKRTFDHMEDLFAEITMELSNASTEYRERAIAAEAPDATPDIDAVADPFHRAETALALLERRIRKAAEDAAMSDHPRLSEALDLTLASAALADLSLAYRLMQAEAANA